MIKINDIKKVNEKHSLQIVDVNRKSFAVELVKDNVCVNLTQLANHYGKRVSHWLKLDDTRMYIDRLAMLEKKALADLLEIRMGGMPGNQGTWALDRRIAIRLAQWLDLDLAIALDGLLVKLLTRGVVIAEPIGGVWPLVQNGVVGYPRKEILLAGGYSTKGGGYVGMLTRKYPDETFNILQVACLSPNLAGYLYQKGELRRLSKNLKAQNNN